MLSIKALLILFLVEMPSVAHGRGISNTYSSSSRSKQDKLLPFHRKPSLQRADMDKVCGTVINLNGDSLPGTFFSLTSGQYPKNFNCILTIKAATANQRVIVVTEKMDVACGGDTLLIYDGKKDPGSVLNKNVSSQCGTGKHAYRVNPWLSAGKYSFAHRLSQFLDSDFEYGYHRIRIKRR